MKFAFYSVKVSVIDRSLVTSVLARTPRSCQLCGFPPNGAILTCEHSVDLDFWETTGRKFLFQLGNEQQQHGGDVENKYIHVCFNIVLNGFIYIVRTIYLPFYKCTIAVIL